MRVAISTIALLASTSLASAADLGGPYEPYGGSIKDEPYVAAAPFSWTGFYIGANVGHGWGNLDTSSIFDPQLPLDGIRANLDPDGWFGGGQIGYNIQSGQMVFGVEADFQGADLSDSASSAFNVQDPLILATSIDVRSFGTVRGRLGLDLGRMMPYVTGGFAWANAKGKTSVTYDNDMYTGSDSNTHTGWVLGGGIEFALDSNWSAKAEYLYYDLGKESYTITYVGPDLGDTYSPKADLDFHTVRIGVNYKFGHR